MVMVTACAQNLLDQIVKWYKEKWNRRHVSENAQAKLVWYFEFNLRKRTTPRRPDLTLAEKQTKSIWIYDHAYPQKNNLEKRIKRRANYRQLAFEIRERKSEFKVNIRPLVISAFGRGIKGHMFEKDDPREKMVAEAQKTI